MNQMRQTPDLMMVFLTVKPGKHMIVTSIWSSSWTLCSWTPYPSSDWSIMQDLYSRLEREGWIQEHPRRFNHPHEPLTPCTIRRVDDSRSFVLPWQQCESLLLTWGCISLLTWSRRFSFSIITEAFDSRKPETSCCPSASSQASFPCMFRAPWTTLSSFPWVPDYVHP